MVDLEQLFERIPFSEGDVQDNFLSVFESQGWERIDGPELEAQGERGFGDPILEGRLRSAISKLNPGATPDDVGKAVEQLRSATGKVHQGLVAGNKEVHALLSEGVTVTRMGGSSTVVKLIDTDTPDNNSFVVSEEVSFATRHSSSKTNSRRFDVVGWVNGLPLIVIELKGPKTGQSGVYKAQKELKETYWEECPEFFATNLFNIASNGKELTYGSVGSALTDKFWVTWDAADSTRLDNKFGDTLRRLALLVSKNNVVRILRDFVLYIGNSKALPRYAQAEAAELIANRVRSNADKRGLIVHHQGTGKTLLMAFASRMIRGDVGMKAPTVIAVVDRRELFNNVSNEFKAAGFSNIRQAESCADLRKAIEEDDFRGVLVTTIHKFNEAGSGAWTDRENVVVLIDECHRTQEGGLAVDMRNALPNAFFFGLTGTPIATSTHNTFGTFSSDLDMGTGGRLHHYSQQRAIDDGVALPLRFSAHYVKHGLSESLDDDVLKELDDLNLDESSKRRVKDKVVSVRALLNSHQHVKSVAAHMHLHAANHMQDGEKAMIVAGDREACIKFYNEMVALLAGVDPSDEDLQAAKNQVAVVISEAKDDEGELKEHRKDAREEKEVENRMKDADSDLKFLIVTAKMLTGFDAPPVCYLYLDKPMRAHNLFQCVTRTNRTWTNPKSGVRKKMGLIISYVGLHKELAEAMVDLEAGETRQSVDLEGLAEEFVTEVKEAVTKYFPENPETLERQELAAQVREKAYEAQEEFEELMPRLAAALKALLPEQKNNEDLSAVLPNFKVLVRVYEVMSEVPESIVEPIAADRLLELLDAAVESAEVHSVQGGVLETTAKLLEGINTKLASLGLQTISDDMSESDIAEALKVTMSEIAAKVNAAALRGNNAEWASVLERLKHLEEASVESAKEIAVVLKQALDLLVEVQEINPSVLGSKENRLANFLSGQLGSTPRDLLDAAKTIDALVAAGLENETWAKVSHSTQVKVKSSLWRRLKDLGLIERPSDKVAKAVLRYVENNY